MVLVQRNDSSGGRSVVKYGTSTTHAKGGDMTRVTVAEDVLIAQPNPSREPDYDLLAERGIESWLVTGWFDGVRFLISPDRAPSSAAPSVSGMELEALATAVRNAAKRYWLVDESGRELPGEWALSDWHTPDFVLGPLRSDDGFVVATATKDGVPLRMGETLVGILRGELERHQLDARISCLPSDVEVMDLPPWDEPVDERHDQDGEKFWYVERSVTRTTTTGVKYFANEYLRPDRQWTSHRSEGIRFPEDDRAGVADFVSEVRARGEDPVGNVSGLLMPADPDNEPSPLPPKEIRERESPS